MGVRFGGKISIVMDRSGVCPFGSIFLMPDNLYDLLGCGMDEMFERYLKDSIDGKEIEGESDETG